MVLGHRVRVAAFSLWALLSSFCTYAAQENTVDALLFESIQYLYTTPEKTVSSLEKLRALQPTFNQAQNEKYHQIYASSLGYRGNHKERVALVRSFLGQVKTPSSRARFLYELIDGSTVLGEYEDALKAMNESILLLPTLDKTGEKIVVLQGAFGLLMALRVYDEALSFADRIYSLGEGSVGTLATCVGLTNKVELNFLRGQSQLAHSFVHDAIQACDANKNQLFTLIVKTHVAIDLLNSTNRSNGIETSLLLLRQFAEISNNSDYVTQLENAVARAYLKAGNAGRAKH